MALKFTQSDIAKSQNTGTLELPAINSQPKPAIVQGLYDLGTQVVQKYDSEGFIEAHRVWVQFEVPSVQVKKDGGEAPLLVGKEMTVSLSNSSNLYELYQSVMGEELNSDSDITEMLGLGCLITLEQKRDPNGNLKFPLFRGITGLPEGMPSPTPTIKREVFDIDDPQECEYMNKIASTKIDESIERRGRKQGSTAPQVDIGAANIDVSEAVEA